MSSSTSSGSSESEISDGPDSLVESDSLDSFQSFEIRESSEENSNSDNDAQEEFGIQPYQFEPLLPGEPAVEGENLPANAAMEVDHPRLHNTDWCNCGFCFVMPSVEESFCCRDEPPNERLINEIGPLNCIIETDTFNDIMRPNILNILFDEFRENNFVPAEDEINPTYRYLIYRLYIRWIYRVLGRRVRRPIPSCAVNRIRREYPSDIYQGYTEPGPV